MAVLDYLKEITGTCSRDDFATFERGLCPRNLDLGEASEGAVEAPSDGDEGR
jgi:hypothetical protein